jgi:hypothetical protein
MSEKKTLAETKLEPNKQWVDVTTVQDDELIFLPTGRRRNHLGEWLTPEEWDQYIDAMELLDRD